MKLRYLMRIERERIHARYLLALTMREYIKKYPGKRREDENYTGKAFRRDLDSI